MSVRYYTRDAKAPPPNPFAAPPWCEDAGLSEVYSTLWTRTHVRTVLYTRCKSPFSEPIRCTTLGRRCRTIGSILYSLDTHTCPYGTIHAMQKSLLRTHSMHHLGAKMPDYRKYTLFSGHAHMSVRYYTCDAKAPPPNPFDAPPWGEDAGLSEVYSTLWTRTHVRTVLYMRCKSPFSEPIRCTTLGRKCRTIGSILYSLDTHTCPYGTIHAIKKPLLRTHSLHHLGAKMPDYRKYILLSGHAHMSVRYYTCDAKAPFSEPIRCSALVCSFTLAVTPCACAAYTKAVTCVRRLTYASSGLPTRRTAWINNREIYRRLSMTAPHKNRNPIPDAHNLPRAKMQSTSCTTFLTLHHRGSYYKKATSLLPH